MTPGSGAILRQAGPSKGDESDAPSRRAAARRPAPWRLPAAGACPDAATDPHPQPSPVPSAAAPTPTLQPTPQPTLGIADVPVFAAGDPAATAVGGLRMRTRPGLDRLVTTVLGPDVGLLIGLGPVFVDGQGWYLVRDPDRTVPPRFNEGCGGRLRARSIPGARRLRAAQPYLAGYAGDRSGEFGPFACPMRTLRPLDRRLADAGRLHLLRRPGADRCRPGAGDPRHGGQCRGARDLFPPSSRITPS